MRTSEMSNDFRTLNQPMGKAGSGHVDSANFSPSMDGREFNASSELLTDSLDRPSSFRTSMCDKCKKTVVYIHLNVDMQ